MKKLPRSAEIFMGVIFLIAGIMGLFLPVLQGILFILIGLALLSTRPTEEYLEYLKRKFHKNTKSTKKHKN